MNSLTWLLAPRTRSTCLSNLDRPLDQPDPSHPPQITHSAPPTQPALPDSAVELGPGPRESEAEMVDKIVDCVERHSGPEAANTLERKVSMGLDGELRLGLPGITERRRAVHLDHSRPKDAHPPELAPQVPPTPAKSLAAYSPYHHLARLLPVRLGVNLYILIRRFLSLFGLHLAPPEPSTEKRIQEQSRPFFPAIWYKLVKKKKPPKAREAPRRNKTLVLDLDETLIHSTSRIGGIGGSKGWAQQSGNSAGLKVRVVEVVLDGRIVVYHVYKRPWVDFFLQTVSSWYTVVIFTASMKEYADPVIDWLDQGRGLIDGRLFRESCTNIKGSYVKDLTIVERDLSKVCLVDNSPISYGLHQANGIPIEGWLNDPTDEGLLELLPMLDSLRFTKDVRRILGLRGFGIESSSKFD